MKEAWYTQLQETATDSASEGPEGPPEKGVH